MASECRIFLKGKYDESLVNVEIFFKGKKRRIASERRILFKGKYEESLLSEEFLLN